METIGGQAVIEGVMLRRRNAYTIAVRDHRKRIIVVKKNIQDYRKGPLRLFAFPLFRGMYSLYEMLTIGLDALIYSSNVSSNEEQNLTKREIVGTIFFSFLLSICFFIILPYALTTLAGLNEKDQPVLFNLADAILKILFFVIYVYAISKMKDVYRVFQYHGAEHMTVHCHEHNLPLTSKNVRKFSPIHPRCGSSFIMLVILVSIVFFAFLPLAVYYLVPSFHETSFLTERAVLVLLRIMLVPFIAGVSYEILKLVGKHPDYFLMKALSLPGVLLQKITTARPDQQQVQVAIAAMKKLLS